MGRVLAVRQLGEAPVNTVYNLGSGHGVSVSQVISICGRALPVGRRPRQPGDPPSPVASWAKAARDLG